MCREEIFQNVIAVSNRKLCTRPFPEQIEIVCRHRLVFIIPFMRKLKRQESEIFICPCGN